MLSINHLLGPGNGRTTIGLSQLFDDGNILKKLHYYVDNNKRCKKGKTLISVAIA